MRLAAASSHPGWPGKAVWPLVPRVPTFEPEVLDVPAPGPDTALRPPRSDAAVPRGAPLDEGRLWLGFRTALVALQVAWLTLVAWLGAAVALLPLVFRGGPVGHRVWSGSPEVMRLLEAPRHEAVPR